MPESTYLQLMQRHVAQISANGSSLRNQGVKGMVSAAQTFLATVALSDLIATTEPAFRTQLDKATEALRLAFPTGGQNFGSARKVLNIFLRDALYNRFLSRAHRLTEIETWLEVPLDGHVASNLRAEPSGLSLPRWDSIRRLTADASQQYQNVATEAAQRITKERSHAGQRKLLRADLDLLWWRDPYNPNNGTPPGAAANSESIREQAGYAVCK